MNRLTIRARLALVFSGLVTLAGGLLLGVTYALVSRRFLTERPLRTAVGDAPGQVPQQSILQLQEDALATLLTQGGIALIVTSAVSIVVGWLVAGRLLRPLQQVTDTARRIAHAPAAERGLHERIALHGPPDEIKELADTFDVMLQRLDRSFDGQRRFIANASHELRTPLSMNRVLIEVAVNRRDAPVETRQLGENLLEVNKRHERLIEGLLLLASSERVLVERHFVDLADIVTYVVAEQPHGPAAIRVEAGEAPTTGDSTLLERLVQNLIGNAVRYNVVDNGWVRVRTDTGPHGEAVLEVSNTGPVVPPYEAPKLFEPFHRLGTEGVGLGLSIVQAVAEAHGGEVRAASRDGGGLTVTVTLPGAGPGPPPPAARARRGVRAGSPPWPARDPVRRTGPPRSSARSDPAPHRSC
jgi:signal transduction histidine kinase